MAEVKLMNNQRGGAPVMVFALISIFTCVIALLTTVQFALYTAKLERVKYHISLATHAASLDVDMELLRRGQLKLDIDAARESFDHFLITNMKLIKVNTKTYEPLPASYINSPLVMLELLFIDDPHNHPDVTDGFFEKELEILNENLEVIARRHIHEVILGPSVVSVVEVKHETFSLFGRAPIVVANVEKIREVLD